MTRKNFFLNCCLQFPTVQGEVEFFFRECCKLFVNSCIFIKILCYFWETYFLPCNPFTPESAKFKTDWQSFKITIWEKLKTKEHHSKVLLNPSRPNNDLSQTSHCNIKRVLVSEVMRIENMITPVKFY